ncbi:acyl-CoA dehydrogenase family protein [Pseudorhodoferax sp. Leaf274]|uniref:acyl-CoA dehydrogenase family protein n=1 Tax=Pseudorhodoferax sp. Leaf274 TaxID=1736318 RepID=UPI000702D9E8|nr:acyl-CoA dehydrogenase family protein [Pseudorhodoferax sp. Leaf274]KQP37026.1 acyl-CoA dehydrogenase [Pseudorhodoferax sp. Leaf274]
MLDFATDEALELVLETARRFAQERLAPQQRAFESALGVPPQLQREAAAIGFERIDWPDSCGGAAMGALARVRMLEALATGCPAAALALQPMGSVAHALLAFGGPQLLDAHAQRLSATPDARACLVFDARGALQRHGNTLSGELAWVPSARIDLLAVLTRDGLVLVDEGLALTAVAGSGLRGAGASAVRLQAAPVRAHWTDRTAAARALAHARLHVAALLVGQMHAAAEYARHYALERVAFGRPIAHHQALAFLIADMHIAVDAARQVAYEAAWRLDADAQDTAAAATAFVEAAESALFIGANAVQILGGAGFMRDVPVEKHLRELRALGLLLGGADAARDDAVAEGALPPFLKTAALEH